MSQFVFSHHCSFYNHCVLRRLGLAEVGKLFSWEEYGWGSYAEGYEEVGGVGGLIRRSNKSKVKKWIYFFWRETFSFLSHVKVRNFMR